MAKTASRRRMFRLRSALAAVVLSILPASALQSAPPTARYLFYLHGAIVEDQGPRGVSPRFGAYDYPGIIAAFRRAGLIVESEVRPRGTDVNAYADKVARQVRAMLARGVAPSHITIVGASKGAVITALVSTRLRQPHVRYVMLANCNDWLIRTHHPRLTGELLSIYEASDQTGGSCDKLAARSPELSRYREVRLTTGLGHGMVYRPLREWMVPAVSWAKR